jgi:predicted nucleotidyltransferase
VEAADRGEAAGAEADLVEDREAEEVSADLAEEVAVAGERAEAGERGVKMAESDRKLAELVGRLKEAAHANLEAVILYGSAARGEFVEGHSDLNVLCVMGSLAAEELKRVAPTVMWWTRDLKEPAPLFFSEKELRESADVFAIELLDMQKEHRVLFGKNVMAGIHVPTNLHRVQVEHELRTALLKLRQHYVLSGGDVNTLANVMAKSISSVKTLLRHALIAFGEQPPGDVKKIFSRVEEITGGEAAAFELAMALRGSSAGGAAAHSKAHGDIAAQFAMYLKAVERVTEALDHHAPKHEWQRAAKANS